MRQHIKAKCHDVIEMLEAGQEVWKACKLTMTKTEEYDVAKWLLKQRYVTFETPDEEKKFKKAKPV